MKLNGAVLVLVMAGTLSWGQRPDTPNTVRGLLGQTATPASAPASLSQPAANASSNAGARQAELVSTGPAKVEPTPRKSYSGKRDPFLSQVVERGSSGPDNCGSGKRCLVIDQMVVRGVVRTANGMIAVVANASNKAYFLKEKDPVFNGVVVKITGDSVVFKERTIDNLGHVGSRDVIKRVNPTPSA
ncbi:MAG: hypothetical protein JOY79_12310 [Acidobacteriaceae bacterium]|nr:hypothetical protein [Acidobacteriaceae bacterium]